MRIPVLIVGAGPVGLTFAAEMGRYGIQCRVVDKAQGTKQISKALILHVRTQEVLDAMGLTHEPQDAAVPMRRIEMIAYGKHIGHGTMEGIDSPHPHPIILGQNVTENILQQHLRQYGIPVEWQTEATSVTQQEQGCTVTLRRPDGAEEILEADYVLGADGTHSTVRATAGVAFEGHRYDGQAFIQSDSKIRWSLPRGVGYLWFTEAGYMMVIEMPNDLVRTFISVPDPGADKNDTTLQEVNEALNRLGGVDAELYDPVWVALFRTNHRAAPTFRNRRVFLAGDAAHEHVPIGGQGMNTSIQDAFNLAWKLAYVIQGKARAELLDTYNEERHPVAESLLAGTDEAYTRLLKAGDLGRAAVKMLGPFLLRQQTVREKIRNTIEEIDINYRSGPLTQDHGGSSGPKAGDRVLDASIVRGGDNQPMQLRDVLRGTRWTLLMFSGRDGKPERYRDLAAMSSRFAQQFGEVATAYVVAGEWQPPAGLSAHGLLWDRMGNAHDKYGISEPCVYLVRPDQYIGFRSSLGEAAMVFDYLSRYITPHYEAAHAD